MPDPVKFAHAAVTYVFSERQPEEKKAYQQVPWDPADVAVITFLAPDLHY